MTTTSTTTPDTCKTCGKFMDGHSYITCWSAGTAETRVFSVGQEVVEGDTGKVGTVVGIAPEANSYGRPSYLVEGLTYPSVAAYVIIPADGPRIRCGCCNHLHGSAAEVRECYAADAEARWEAETTPSWA
jgi:hypothetical protein